MYGDTIELHLCWVRQTAHLHGEDAVLPEHRRGSQGCPHWFPGAG